jgi:hypothetical protein
MLARCRMVPTTVDVKKDTATAGVRRQHTGHPQPGRERQAAVYLTQGRSTWTSAGPAGSCHCLVVGSETAPPPAGIPDDILFVTQPALAG